MEPTEHPLRLTPSSKRPDETNCEKNSFSKGKFEDWGGGQNMSETDVLRESGQGLLLTPEGFAALHAELDNLTMVKRPEIAERIRESLQHGEFSEDNSELDEVKFEQAFVENRIGELKAIFSGATIMDVTTIPTDHVGMGSLVSILDPEFGDVFSLRLVASVEANPDKDLLSSESPMGLALYGKKVGDVVEVDAPGGLRKYSVKAISR
jgi:transcription elongation factor GreA